VQWYAQGLFKDGNESSTDGHAYFQEGWLRFTHSPGVNVSVGQFKPPFGLERFTPDFEIMTIDRSAVTDALTPDGSYVDSFFRDRGLQLDGATTHRRFRYAVGVFDGRGANHGFHGVGPLISGQVRTDVVRNGWHRLRFDLAVGTSYSWRRGLDLPFRSCCERLSASMSHFRGVDRRWSADLSLNSRFVTVRAELIRATFSFDQNPSLDFRASGYYIQAARFLARRWQVVAKFERFDPNHDVHAPNDLTAFTTGLNYYLAANRIKLMTNYVARDVGRREHLLQVQIQYFIH
jgi:phosphate-selective porin